MLLYYDNLFTIQKLLYKKNYTEAKYRIMSSLKATFPKLDLIPTSGMNPCNASKINIVGMFKSVSYSFGNHRYCGYPQRWWFVFQDTVYTYAGQSYHCRFLLGIPRRNGREKHRCKTLLDILLNINIHSS